MEATVKTRRRRTEETRQRHDAVRDTVRRAALELIEQAPYKDLTVDEIARAADISRTSFYFYFRDKQELLLAAVEEVAGELYEQAERWWHGEGPGVERVRPALEGIVAVYGEHVGLMRVATEVSTYDEDFGDFWRGLVGRFVEATAEHIRTEQRADTIRGELDPVTTSEALVWMVERYSYMYLRRGLRSREELVDSLTSVWTATLYPEAVARN